MPDGGSGQVDGLSPGRAAAAALASVPAGAVVASGGLVCADELPDGVVVADHAARIAVFNRAAERLTGIASLNALGRDVRQVLPLHDADGRSWWTFIDPYRGLSTRTRHPETSLYLADGTEFLVRSETSGRYCRCTTRTGAAGGPSSTPTGGCPPGPGTRRHRSTWRTVPSSWSPWAMCAGLGAARSEEHTSELQSLRHLV